MMMGFGSFSSSSSNLSALAQPFTVDRSVSKPLVDLSEPPLNWLNTHPLPFDSSIKTSNFVEAEPYYPSYISPTYDDYTQSLTGLWDGSNSWNYPKNDINVSDFPVYKDHMDAAAHSPKVLKTCEQKSHILGSEKHLGSCKIDGFDYKSFPGQNTEFLPVEYSRKSFVGSSSVFPETYSLASYEKGICSNDISSVRKSSPGLVIRAPNTTSFNNVGIGSRAQTMDFTANNNLFEGKVCVDSSKGSFNLQGDNFNFLELAPEKKERHLSNISVTKDPFRTNSGLQVTHISPGGNESLNCFENSSDSLDHFNHAVDSPCWKGVPVSHYSDLETSGLVPPQLTKTIEACSGSNFIGPTSNTVNVCSQKPSEFPLYQGCGCPENDLAPSPERISVANMLIQEFGSHDDVKDGSYPLKSSYGCGFQLSNDIEKSRKEYALSKKSIYELNFKPFHSTQQGHEEGKLTSEIKSKSGSGVADVGSDSSEGCSSHVPFHATEHVLSSPPAVEVASSELTKMCGNELASKTCVQTLINTMHNLSELLLSYCSNEACELKNQELSVLKNVINNLDKCILKNFGTVVPSQELLFPDKASEFLGGLPKLHKGVTMSRSQLTMTAAATDLNHHDYQHARGGSKHYIASDKLDEKLWDFASLMGDADREKDHNVTQAIKKVLSENFSEEEGAHPQILLYKNLWLEAEAALCSVNYRARFNRMKIEMEKSKSFKAKDLSENTTVASELSKNNVGVEKISWSSFPPDINMADELKPEVNNDSIQDVSVPAPLIVTTGDHPDDVMARFNILKCKVDSANNARTADAPEISSSQIGFDLNEFDRMAPAAKDDQTPDTLSWDLPVLSPTSHKVEASVMARFQILKNRADNAVCTDIEGELPRTFNLEFGGVKKHGPAVDEVLDRNMEPVLQCNFSSHTEDKLTREFHLHVKDDPVIHVHGTDRLGNQLSGPSYDSSSSDWEHVLKEELPGQNC